MGILGSIPGMSLLPGGVKAVPGAIGGVSQFLSLVGGVSKDAPRNTIPKIGDIPTSKTVLDLQKQLNEIPGVTPIDSYKAKDVSGPLPEYDIARQRLKEDINTQSSATQQAAQEALARRFAAMGGGMNSGAFIKQAALADQSNEENKAEAIRKGMLDILGKEAETRRGLQMAESQKEFQSGETSRAFNAQQAFQDKVFRFDSASKLGQLDLAYKSAELNAATEAYNAELNAYTAKHSGGLLGAGGFLGTGIGV